MISELSKHFLKYTAVGLAAGLGPGALAYAALRAIREVSRDVSEQYNPFSFASKTKNVGQNLNRAA